MTPTTKLEAVNIMLSTIGESPVNSLSSGLVDAELAETILDSTSKAVQSEGWNFNRDDAFTVAPNLSGEIVIPLNVLRADATLKSDSKDLVQRGTKMYDKKEHTFIINESVELDLIVELAFTDLPEIARRYVALRAARVFQERVVGSDFISDINRVDERFAYYQLQEFETDTEDHNIFNNNDVYRVINRVGSTRLT
jgi:hypothetical protein